MEGTSGVMFWKRPSASLKRRSLCGYVLRTAVTVTTDVGAQPTQVLPSRGPMHDSPSGTSFLRRTFTQLGEAPTDALEKDVR